MELRQERIDWWNHPHCYLLDKPVCTDCLTVLHISLIDAFYHHCSRKYPYRRRFKPNKCRCKNCVKQDQLRRRMIQTFLI